MVYFYFICISFTGNKIYLNKLSLGIIKLNVFYFERKIYSYFNRIFRFMGGY